MTGGRGGSGLSLRATFLGVALAVVVPFLLLLGFLVYGDVSQEKMRVRRDAASHARDLAAQIERHLGARLDAALSAGGAVAASGKDPGVVDAQVRRLRQSFPDAERIVVADELGAVLAALPAGGEGRRSGVGDQEWFKRAATSAEPFLAGAVQAGPDVLVSLYAPARTAEGQLRGVIAVDLSLKRVQDLLAQARLGPGAVAEVLSEGGLVVARQPALFLLQDVRGLAGYPDLLRRPEDTGELAFEDHELRLTGAAAVRAAGWVVAVGLPSAQVLAESRRRLGIVAALAVLVAGAGLTAAVLIARRQAQGMERLRAAMRRLEAGDLPASVPVTVGGDLGALSEGLNRMLGWLRAKLRDYEALSQVEEAAGAAIGGETSVATVLPGLLRKVVGGMGADVAVLVLQDESGLVTRAGVGFGGVVTEGVRLRPGQGLAGAVMTERAAVAVPDVETDFRVDEPYLKGASLRSVVGVPVVSADQVIGAIQVGYRMPHAFTEAEIQRLEAMARRAAQALEHARALDAVQRNTAGLESRLAEQLEALQKAALDQAEARRQAQEARRQALEMEQALKRQAALPPVVKEVSVVKEVPVVKEVIVEKEVVRYDSTGTEGARWRAAMQKTVSEELRAPLMALLDLPRFLVEGLHKPLGEEERRQLEVLRDRGEEILELIDSLVVLSGLDAGHVKIVKAPFDLPTLIHRVVRSLQPRAAAKGNRIDADIKLHVGQVVSDVKRVEQILTNLLVSAIRYTEVGEIRVTCYPRDGEIVLTVADDGAGFTPDEQARIFEPFLQVGPREGRALPGTGLLLTVCQRLVEGLGGRIRVESEVDRGTWVTVSLPAPS